MHVTIPVSKAYKYRGNLAGTTLPEMLFSIDRFHVPGVVEARRSDVIKRVYVERGYVIHASSTDRGDSLGAYLLARKLVPLAQLDRLTRQRARSNKRFGVLLLEEGLLSPRQVLTAIREQIEAIIWSLFYWDHGEVTFGLGELEAEDIVQIQLPIRQVIIEGIRRAPDARTLVTRLGHKETILEPCFELENLIETGLDDADYEVLESVDGKRTLYELCAQGRKPAGEVAKLLYAFRVLHLVRPSDAASHSSSGPLKIQLGSPGAKL